MMVTKNSGLAGAVLAAALACWAGGCSEAPAAPAAKEGRIAPGATAAPAPAKSRPRTKIFGLDVSLLGTDRWVTKYDPKRTWTGYNLLLLARRTPALMDMNGNIVHSWPDVQAMGRARLTKEGHLLYQDKAGPLKIVSWEGAPVWSYERPGADFSHHDVIQLRNGDVASIWRNVESRLDYIQVIDMAGEVVFTWKTDDYFLKEIKGRTTDKNDPTHLNSIQEIPPNRHFDEGDVRFRPGNFLLSARHLNEIFIVDRLTGDVVWSFGEGLVAQHEAAMIEKGRADAGNIVVFNNVGNSQSRREQSSVWVIDPVRRTRTWEFTAEYFFSSGGGVAQPLPNGDFMIASSRGGRIFEVDAGGTILWQLEPPYLPMRPARYPLDFCPQLAALPRPAAREVESSGATYVSRELYDLIEKNEFGKRRIRGVDTSILVPKMGDAGLIFRIDESGVHEYCKNIVVPGESELSLGFMLDPQSEEDARSGPVKMEFLAWFTDEGGERRDLLREVLDSAEPADLSPRKREIDLGALTLRRGRLCLGTRALTPCDEDRHERLAVWLPPRIEKKWIKALNYKGMFKKAGAGAQVLDPALQMKLRALGYLD